MVKNTGFIDVVLTNTCGLDICKKYIDATWGKCDPNGQNGVSEYRRFKNTNRGVRQLKDWLISHDCKHVCMESTGQLWVLIFNVLEDYMEEVRVVHPKWVKAIKGRKDDKKDSAYIMNQYRLGQTRGSFIPKKAIRDLRALCRNHKKLIRQRTQILNRRNDILVRNNYRLDQVFSNLNAKSARKIMDLISSGTSFTSDDIMACVHKNCTADREDILDAVDGVILSETECFQLGMMNEDLDKVQNQIDRYEKKIDLLAEDVFGNAINLLTTIPGIAKRSAITILSEIGNDMSQFPTAAHLASWAGLAPTSNESGGKKFSVHIAKGNKSLKTTLVECAIAARMNNPYFACKFSLIEKNRGAKRANIAIARKMLVAIYYMLKKNEPFHPTDVKDTFNPKEILLKNDLIQIERIVEELVACGKSRREISKMIKAEVKKKAKAT